MNRLKDKKGIALVYIALMLVVIMAFVGLAIDIGYMYVAKGQLQNAADAAALAGATQLIKLPDQTYIKEQAKKFASSNNAAGENVIITDSDITIGNWDNTKTPKFSISRTPINAVRVVARRNVAGATAANQGKVKVFFGKILSLAPIGGSDWSEMSAAAEAIATQPPRPGAGLTLCTAAENFVGQNNVTFYLKESDLTQSGVDASYGAAFTEYLPARSTDFSPNGLIQQYINGRPSPLASGMCNTPIMTNNAPPNNILRMLQDRVNAEAVIYGYWEIIIPLVRPANPPYCPPGAQPTEPYTVIKFLRIRLKSVTLNPDATLLADVVEVIECDRIDEISGIFKSQLVK